jgi:CheY-like chemotaxis protein
MDTKQGNASPSLHDNQQEQPATILLVDDIDVMRELAKTILTNYGYTVLEANDGDTCVKIGQEYPGPIHLLLADFFMPGMNGREVATRLLACRQRDEGPVDVGSFA